MNRDAWPDGYDLISLDTVDSTNAEARRRHADLAGPTWIFAKRQTAGRGRRGRPWVMPDGNFAATLVQSSSNSEQCALLSFVAALAVRDACCEVTGLSEEFALKWPNDVLLNGEKCSGILLEGLSGSPGRIAVGIGVNLAAAPSREELELGARVPVSLSEHREVSPEAYLPVLARAFALRCRTLENFGFSPIREAWLSNAAMLGEPIVARTAREELRGTFETLDMSGALVLSTTQGRRLVQAADIYF